jgi:NAD(P)-dependent dehydrogenase (short-subunit alcohol dehydrogenase family)
MAKIFITGSADGLGQMAAKLLVAQGHAVTLHARSEARAKEALAGVPGAAGALAGDLSSIDAMKSVASQANELGAFDAVIHNAAVGYQEPRRVATVDGLAHLFAINSLAPYVLTASMHKPKRLVYISSGLHRGGDTSLHDLAWAEKKWNGSQAYSDSKLQNALLAFAIARLWPQVLSNAIEPGWVATKMGGKGAPDDLAAGPKTQAWLAVSDEPAAKVTGGYFYHQQPKDALPAVHDASLQDRLIAAYFKLSGVALPA